MDRAAIEQFYRDEFGRVLATVIRLVGDISVAEESVQDAFATALEQWPAQGAPGNPRAWLVSTARHKAIDTLRRSGRFEKIRHELAHIAPTQAEPGDGGDSNGAIPDERLRLIFTCCHPALAPEAQVALSLRTLCGLSTEEIARAFLTSTPTMAQRLVRAKNKIRTAGIPYEVPSAKLLPERLEGVLAVVYLVFNEGYAASAGDELVRADLCQEAIRLGRLLCNLMPEQPEARGLLALMLLNDARRAARTTADGELVLLEDQQRSAWNQDQIREGLALLANGGQVPVGPYFLQAAIAAEHARAATPADTDWRAIAAFYASLLQLQPSPVVELNRAVAIAMAEGPAAGLQLLASLKERGELDSYHLLWAVEADLLRRAGRKQEASHSYRRALDLVTNEAERRFLQKRLARL